MFLRYHLPTLLWALFILVICAIPGERIPKLTFLEWLKPDKIVHFLVFAFLSLLLLRSFIDAGLLSWKQNNIVVFAVCLAIIYGALVEFLQYSVFINRSGDIRDALANAIGALIGWWIYKRYLLSKKSDNKLQ